MYLTSKHEAMSSKSSTERKRESERERERDVAADLIAQTYLFPIMGHTWDNKASAKSLH
jgi:hypothetical protein